MLRLKITPPFTLAIPINPEYLAPELLAELFATEGIQIVSDATQAELELVSIPRVYEKSRWTLPKSQVIVVENEPPHPEYLYEAYFQQGWASVLTPLNGGIYSKDCLSFFPSSGEIAQMRRMRQEPEFDSGYRLIQLSTYRALGGTPENFVPVVINGKIRFAPFVLSNLRCQLGLDLKKTFPARVAIFGEGWPPGISIENSRPLPNWFDRKLELVRGYHFDLCWENFEIPYWVTEKIWMAIGMGLVPLYWGCDEMHRLFPRDSIIDCREFVVESGFKHRGLALDLKSLSRAVFEMDSAEYRRRRQTLLDWFDSFAPDTQQRSLLRAAKQMAQTINEIAAQL